MTLLASARGAVVLTTLSVGVLAGCGGGGDAGPSVPVVDTKPASILATTSTGFNVSTGQPVLIRVQVVTKAGAPVNNALVTFTASGSGAVANPTKRTDLNGLAATTWGIGPEPGQQTVVASVEGVSTTVQFTATVTIAITGRWVGTIGFVPNQQVLTMDLVEKNGAITGTATLTNTPTGTRVLSVAGIYTFPTALTATMTETGLQTVSLTSTVVGKTLNSRLSGGGFVDETVILSKQSQ